MEPDGFQARDRSVVALRTGKGGAKDVLAPMQQMIASTARSVPSVDFIPDGVKDSISVVMYWTLGCAVASRYPGPGVSLLQLGEKSNKMVSRRSLRSPSLTFKRVLTRSRSSVELCPPRTEFRHPVNDRLSMRLRYIKYSSGSANVLRMSSESRSEGSSPKLGATQVGLRT